MTCTCRAEAGCQVLDRVTGHPGRQLVIDRIADAPGQRCMGLHLPRADRHVEPTLDFFQQKLDVFRVVLAIGVHKYQDVAFGISGAGLDGGTVTHGVNVGQNPDVVLAADFCGVIR